MPLVWFQLCILGTRGSVPGHQPLDLGLDEHLSNIFGLTDRGGLNPTWLFVVVGGIMLGWGLLAELIEALWEDTFFVKILVTVMVAFISRDWT